jgi:cbb3-type cytochrome oxidase subunit 3
MRKFFKNNERGAVSGYAIGLIVLAILLVGGVMLLRNTGKDTAETNKPVETGEFKADDTKDNTETEKTEETKPEPVATGDSEKTETTTPTAATTPSVATTGDTTEQLAVTGPEDFIAVAIGLVLAGGTAYALWNYAKSRSAVKVALLSK